MGDLFGDWVPDSWIRRVLEATQTAPRATFMFFTKNPERYRDFLDLFPPNSWLGATIETDIECVASRYSQAPSVLDRLVAMRKLDWPNKVISVEPIMVFSAAFPKLLIRTGARLFYVGYDNHGSNLPEPPLELTIKLIETLEASGAEVRKKTLRSTRWEDA